MQDEPKPHQLSPEPAQQWKNAAKQLPILAVFFIFAGWLFWPDGEDTEDAPQCTLEEMAPAVDMMWASMREDMQSESRWVEGCNTYADWLAGNSQSTSAWLRRLPSPEGCAPMPGFQRRDYLNELTEAYRPTARDLCGPGLEARVEMSIYKERFVGLLSDTRAGEAADVIGDRLALFAPDPEFRACLENSGFQYDPVVQKQRFTRVVAACEVMLGIKPKRPTNRWTIPSVDDPAQGPT
ncbi:hypothetical protein [Croceicoccus gelatinilyticus]|uniref:hypothetical protein n=1 Tax=Croceicoccus gelatinilyticus TaxID=2835536 RepID=UPI001BD176C0|nr:hypothetical protein [Croceicoccus gelatinilyticus]MBS7671308.1 hypothetical protein [Croceicoccus gelatinilyticus]